MLASCKNRFRHDLNRLLQAGLLGLIAGTSALAADIHMAANGSDLEDGHDESHSVATLGRALDIALSHPKRSSEPLRILIQSGTYRGQRLSLDGTKLMGQLTIIGKASEPKDFPVFVGDGDQTTWLTLKSSSGKQTGLTIQALNIRRYFTAISLEGNRNRPDAFNAGTTIRRNVFESIGAIATNNGSESTAAIRLVNSKDDVIESNYFKTIRNRPNQDCGGLHAIYVAHFSSGNRIAENTFDDACGSVIKLRDRSNNNTIESNRFKAIEKAPAIEEWFCDKSARKDCTKALGECPSTGNVEKNNDLSKSPGTIKVLIVGERTQRSWCSVEDFNTPPVLAE